MGQWVGRPGRGRKWKRQRLRIVERARTDHGVPRLLTKFWLQFLRLLHGMEAIT
jgi:hypothetical protein